MRLEGRSWRLRSKREVEAAEEAEVDEEEEIEVAEVAEAEVVEEVRTQPGKSLRRSPLWPSREAAQLHLKRDLQPSWVISPVSSRQNSRRATSTEISFTIVISFTKCTSQWLDSTL